MGLKILMWNHHGSKIAVAENSAVEDENNRPLEFFFDSGQTYICTEYRSLGTCTLPP
jgi:hypothetical protein